MSDRDDRGDFLAGGRPGDAESRGANHRRRSRKPRDSRPLSDVLESLERRTMLAANTLDVAKVMWNGRLVDGVKDEYILRMPQLNKATAKSPLDYQCKAPVAQAGWSVQSLGSGFFKLKAAGVTQTTLSNWARGQGASSIVVNAVHRLARTPNDPLYTDASNWAFPQIDADLAWDTGTGTKPTIVAVLDTGVDYNHADLSANMWRNPNEIAGDGVDNDSNGYVDDVHGINAITGTGNPMDDNGHGTFCSGLIGAVGNNATGMAGVNWSVSVMAVKIFDANGVTSLTSIITGINYVIAQKTAGQNVAATNHSYGGGFLDSNEQAAMANLESVGIVTVAAAGNEANDNDISPRYPANFATLSVAASTQADTLANFSNYGRTTVDLAAPGVNVLSTRSSLADPLAYPPLPADNTFSISSGTSFAAPLVAGTAALLKSLKPAASVQQIRTAILDGVDRFASMNGLVASGGRLNVKNAVDLVLSTQGTVPVASFPSQSLEFLEGNSGYTFADIKIVLDRPPDPGKSAAVWYETRPGGSAISNVDFVAQSGFVTFSNSEMEKTFRIRIIGDRLAETAEQFAIRLDAAKSRGATIGTAQANVVILDDDNTSNPVQPGPTNPGLVPRVSIDVKREAPDPANPALPPQVPFREGGMATFVVSLDKTSNKTVSVKYRTNQPVLVPVNTALENVDYKATSGTLVFRPGERTKEVTVPLILDKITDNNEQLHMVLFEPINADLAGGTTPGTGGAATGVITDVGFVPPPAAGFQITVTFPDSSLTTTQQQVFQQAANRWQEIIVGDLPNVTDPATGQVIDDVLIEATGPAIDGAGGILGAAGPTDFRPGAAGLPWKGVMFFDSADIASMEADGTFKNVILHEMAHVLGFGTMWQKLGLLRNGGTANPTYTGTNALREYRSIFGLPAAAGVPVENSGGQGTADSHWRETIFRTEMMTGYAEPAGVAMPISRITVGQFQDIGYQVNYAKADPYTKPVPLTAPPSVRVTPPASLRGRPISVSQRPAVGTRVVSPQVVAAAAAANPPKTTLGTPAKKSAVAVLAVG